MNKDQAISELATILKIERDQASRLITLLTVVGGTTTAEVSAGVKAKTQINALTSSSTAADIVAALKA